jgi:hypothetical protein
VNLLVTLALLKRLLQGPQCTIAEIITTGSTMRAGLSANLSRKSLGNIPKILMSCVLMLKDQKACILQSGVYYATD